MLIPNRLTFTRSPELSKVDTSNGMPNKLSVIVSVPSLLIVSTPPRIASRNASSGGACNVGGVGGGDGGGDGGDDGVGTDMNVVAWAAVGVGWTLPTLSVATL